MIKSKEDLQYYLSQDRKAMGKTGKPKLFRDEIYRFEIAMRKLEYHTNVSGSVFGKLYYRLKYHRLSVKLGFSVPINVFEEGLSIVHYGYLAVSKGAKVGKNCRIQTGVVIGATGGQKEAPIIGDNVYIGAGAKLIGNIRIADHVAIGANAVVVKDITEPNTTWGGVPAKKISNKDSSAHLGNLLKQEQRHEEKRK